MTTKHQHPGEVRGPRARRASATFLTVVVLLTLGGLRASVAEAEHSARTGNVVRLVDAGGDGSADDYIALLGYMLTARLTSSSFAELRSYDFASSDELTSFIVLDGVVELRRVRADDRRGRTQRGCYDLYGRADAQPI